MSYAGKIILDSQTTVYPSSYPRRIFKNIQWLRENRPREVGHKFFSPKHKIFIGGLWLLLDGKLYQYINQMKGLESYFHILYRNIAKYFVFVPKLSVKYKTIFHNLF